MNLTMHSNLIVIELEPTDNALVQRGQNGVVVQVIEQVVQQKPENFKLRIFNPDENVENVEENEGPDFEDAIAQLRSAAIEEEWSEYDSTTEDEQNNNI
jgi:hypothetical protein